MTYRGYPERDLVSNRASLLLYGSTETERRAWAEEAAELRPADGSLKVVANDSDLKQALGVQRGILYIPDVSQIGDSTQLELVRVLRERDERPKVIVGITGKPDTAREAGRLRSDLQYALHHAQVNLDEPGLKESLKLRRAQSQKRVPAQATKPAASATANAPASAAAASKSAAPAPARAQQEAPKQAARTKAASSKPKPTGRKTPARKSSPAPSRKPSAPRKAANGGKAKSRRR